MTELDDAKVLNGRAAEMALNGNTIGATAAAIAAIGKLIEHLEKGDR